MIWIGKTTSVYDDGHDPSCNFLHGHKPRGIHKYVWDDGTLRAKWDRVVGENKSRQLWAYTEGTSQHFPVYCTYTIHYPKTGHSSNTTAILSICEKERAQVKLIRRTKGRSILALAAAWSGKEISNKEFMSFQPFSFKLLAVGRRERVSEW